MGEETRVTRITETLRIQDQQTRNHLWSIYDRAFEKLNTRTPIHHGAFTKAEFDGILQDPDFIKFLIYVDNEVGGVCLITAAIEKIPWINAGYFQQRYPELYDKRKIFFLPAAVIAPEHQGLRLIGAKLLGHAITSIGKDGILVADYSETLRHGLPAFVQRALGETFQGEVLDRQIYEIFYDQPPRNRPFLLNNRI